LGKQDSDLILIPHQYIIGGEPEYQKEVFNEDFSQLSYALRKCKEFQSIFIKNRFFGPE